MKIDEKLRKKLEKTWKNLIFSKKSKIEIGHWWLSQFHQKYSKSIQKKIMWRQTLMSFQYFLNTFFHNIVRKSIQKYSKSIEKVFKNFFSISILDDLKCQKYFLVNFVIIQQSISGTIINIVQHKNIVKKFIMIAIQMKKYKKIVRLNYKLHHFQTGTQHRHQPNRPV